MTPGRKAALAAIRGYQRGISPLLPSSCRFLPSCSEYTRMAIEDWGVARGSWLGLKRILRCHPFHPGGLDLPPRPAGAARRETTEEQAGAGRDDRAAASGEATPS